LFNYKILITFEIQRNEKKNTIRKIKNIRYKKIEVRTNNYINELFLSNLKNYFKLLNKWVLVKRHVLYVSYFIDSY